MLCVQRGSDSTRLGEYKDKKIEAGEKNLSDGTTSMKIGRNYTEMTRNTGE